MFRHCAPRRPDQPVVCPLFESDRFKITKYKGRFVQGRTMEQRGRVGQNRLPRGQAFFVPAQRSKTHALLFRPEAGTCSTSVNSFGMRSNILPRSGDKQHQCKLLEEQTRSWQSMYLLFIGRTARALRSWLQQKFRTPWILQMCIASSVSGVRCNSRTCLA